MGKSISKSSNLSLFYERVLFLCTNTVTESEKNPLLSLKHGTATRLKKKIRQLGITREIVLKLSPGELRDRYFKNYDPAAKSIIRGKNVYLLPDFALITRTYMNSREHGGSSTERKLELQRKIIYEDVYCSEENRKICEEQHKTLYSLASFNRLWRQYEKSCVAPSFRRHEIPGACAEFDFTGATLRCADGTKAQFAVLVLSYSRKVFVMATPSQNIEDSVAAVLAGFKYFGGTTEILAVDNFKAAVTCAGRYGGEFTAAFRMLTGFLGLTLSSMPPKSPKIKGHAEAAVKLVSHTLIARMKQVEREGQPFKNIAAINDWLLRHLDLINDHPVRGLKASRNEIFVQDEQPLLHKPQSWDFNLSEFVTRTVPPTSRFSINGHEYCLPPHLIGHKVQMEVRPQQIVFYEYGRPVCTYKRTDNTPGISTKEGFNPDRHLYIEVLKALPLSMYYEWGLAIGPETHKKVKSILSSSPNIDKYRRAVKLLSLPHENPALYPVFEKFLKSVPHHTGISKISSLWKIWPDKPNVIEKDQVYRFGRLYSMVKAKLYGSDVKLSWYLEGEQHPKPERKGLVFLNYQKKSAEKSQIVSSGKDPSATSGNDPNKTRQCDPSATEPRNQTFTATSDPSSTIKKEK